MSLDGLRTARVMRSESFRRTSWVALESKIFILTTNASKEELAAYFVGSDWNPK